MILTLTPNPSTDSTLHLTDPLTVGGVSRAASVSRVAGGKGVNVSRAIFKARQPTLALFPAGPTDPFLPLIRDTGVEFHAVDIESAVRTNVTITESDGRTTKLNGPGPLLAPEQVDALLETLSDWAPSARAVVLAGSLPPGVPPDFYLRAVAAVRAVSPATMIAVDTSDEALVGSAGGFSTAAPTIIKPNSFELGQLVGCDGGELERAAASGDFSPVVEAGCRVVGEGVAEVLITLGASGAVLVTAEGAWHATPPPVTVRSTVGAGDCALAGYLLARTTGGDPTACLRRAVAYGTAASGLPGTRLPTPQHLDLAGTHVTPVRVLH